MAEQAVRISPVDDAHVERARQRARHILQQGTVSQQELARIIGISPATLSQFMAAKYAGDNRAVADRIHYALDKHQQQLAAPKDPDYVTTSFTEAVQTVLSYAHVQKTMGMIHGDAGVGKTMAIQAYAKEHPDVVVLDADPSLRSPKAVVEELLDLLGRRERGSWHYETKVLVEALRGSGRLIVVDEAHHLTKPAMDTLRRVHDKAEVGIVFCGNHELYERLRGRGEASYAQFFSRLGIRRCLQAPVPADDVKRIFGDYVPPECLETLQAAANSGKGIRGAVKLYRLAATFAAKQGEALSPALLQHAGRFLMMGGALG